MSTQTKTEHTPGQSGKAMNHPRLGWFVVWGNGFRSAMPDEQTAKQSAAARELLEACKAVSNLTFSYEQDSAGGNAIAKMRQAIAKATGGQQ